jgi:hypothetical protein
MGQAETQSKVYNRTWRSGHEMTLMDITVARAMHEPGYGSWDWDTTGLQKYLPPNNTDDEYKTPQQIAQLVQNFLLNRQAISEHYDSAIYLQNIPDGELHQQFHEHITAVRFIALPTTYGQARMQMGGTTKQWMKQRLLPLQMDVGAEEGLCVPAAMMHHINTIFEAGAPDASKPTRLKNALGHIRSMEELAGIFGLLDGEGQVKRFWTLEDVTQISETPFIPPYNRITGRQTKSNAATKLIMSLN